MKAGIAVDNYKLDRFEKELKEYGFKDYDVNPFTADTSLISVRLEKKRLPELKRLVTELELHSKRRN